MSKPLLSHVIFLFYTYLSNKHTKSKLSQFKFSWCVTYDRRVGQNGTVVGMYIINCPGIYVFLYDKFYKIIYIVSEE